MADVMYRTAGLADRRALFEEVEANFATGGECAARQSHFWRYQAQYRCRDIDTSDLVSLPSMMPADLPGISRCFQTRTWVFERL